MQEGEAYFEDLWMRCAVSGCYDHMESLDYLQEEDIRGFAIKMRFPPSFDELLLNA